MSEETAQCTICKQPLDSDGRCRHCDEESRVWTLRDWRLLAKLALVIVLGFSFTRLVVNLYNEMQSGLGGEYYATGIRATEEHHAAAAAGAFETALVYVPGNYEYRLKLADALVASGATGEAEEELLSFREQRPEDAQVNLRLARLEAKKKNAEEAVRYFQNAIEGVWPAGSDAAAERLGVRLEEAEFLVSVEQKEAAKAALLELATVLPESSPEQGRLAELFLRNGNAAESLKAYQAVIKGRGLDRAAVMGAARASYEAGEYATARRFLEELKPETAESQELRLALERMEALDPFARGATAKTRAQRTLTAFHIAMERLAECGVPFAKTMRRGSASEAKSVDAGPWSGLAKWAEQLTPLMSERKLQGKDDVIENAMRFAFQAEMAAQRDCGKASLDDEALLLLARERMGAE
jgi:tetratricopeptide (TPR) repeat protein